MTAESLPAFRYHPDPIATGSVEPSTAECICCNSARGYIYTGPAYARREYHRCICPWCITDGAAHRKLDASFHDDTGFVGDSADDLPASVVDEISHRTPGFAGWQQERWWTHCEDAAQIVGRAGHDELIAAGPRAVAELQESSALPEGPKWQHLLRSLNARGSPRAYLFKCSKCGRSGGYLDCD